MRIVFVVALAACAHSAPVGELRFKNRDPVWRVDDHRPIGAKPEKRAYNRALYHVDGFIFRRIDRALEMRGHVRARDINSIEEVPDSSWFTNRIGMREMTLDELRAGSAISESPFDNLPWTITGGKDGGFDLGFEFEDARGAKYILKFDDPNEPELATGAHMIASRILYAIGYNVPEDYLGEIDRKDLEVGPKSKLTPSKLDRKLAMVPRRPDGKLRVLASRMIRGDAIGPYAREGKRDDDANDVIPHEDRRSLRGQYAIFSWLNHIDVQEDNTLDTYVDGHVVHYLIDFGSALGVMGHSLRWQTPGHTYRVDIGVAVRGILGFGFVKRPWDGLRQPPIRGIGLIDAEHFRPGSWRPNSFYWPLEEKDRFDAFWGAKLLMRFTREQLAAIVGVAQYSDPRASQYMLDTLVARQRATAKYWFEQVAPLDGFAVDGGALVFRDLLLAYHLRDVPTRYLVEAFDRAGRRIDARMIAASPDGAVRIDDLALSRAADGYTILRVQVVREQIAMAPVEVHVARSDSGDVRVIGLRRR
jgi:hypothetical protein